jgi:ferredoxin--NADP+ reductase
MSAKEDRVMMCGSPSMLRDLVEIVRARGFNEGNSSAPGQYVIEKAFVEK